MNQPDNMTLKAIVEKPQSDSGSGKGTENEPTSLSERFLWPGKIALLIAVVLSPWIFASVENRAQCMITIALLFGLAFGWFETALNKRSTQVFPYIFVLVFLGLVIALIQTLPLPDAIAQLVLGRQQEIYAEFSGNVDSRVSISVDREGTWNQIRLLIIAVSGLFLGGRFFRTKRDITLLLSVVSVNGLLIGFFGVVHKLTDNGKMFWFHEISAGSPFGPFVNRNNSAGYLLMCLGCCLGLLPIVMAKRKTTGPQNIISREIPIWRQLYFHMLAFIAELTAPKVAVLIGTIMIATAIPASLSRGGVIGLLVASIGTILVYGVARKPKNLGVVLIPMLGLIVALTTWIGLGDDLIERFEKIDTVNVGEADGRVQHWKDTWPAVGEMGLLGSGLGSYKNVHRLYRTGPENTIFVYAENQYFQSVVESGWLGLILFLLAWILAFKYATLALHEGNSPTTIGVGTMGVFVVLSQATVSLFDFGLYIPANMLLLAVLVGFLAYHSQALSGRLKKKSWLRFQTPNNVVQVVVLVLFAASTMVALDLYRRSDLDGLMRPKAVQFDRTNMDMDKTIERIAALTTRFQRTPAVDAMNYAGELWMHRSRLALFEKMTTSDDFKAQIAVMDQSNQEQLTENLWSLTSIQRMQETAFHLRRELPRYEAEEVLKFLKGASISENLQSALSYFSTSREASPLQPLVHLRIGEIKGVIAKPRAGDIDIERALQLAPSNPVFRLVAGVYYLQSGDPEAAVPHLKKYLELAPNRFHHLMPLITGRTNRNLVQVDEATIAKILPDDGRMLFDYVVMYMPPDSSFKEEFLKRAAQAVADVPTNIRENHVLLGDIQFRQGEPEKAAASYASALIRQPNDPITRFRRARILFDLKRFDEALKEANYLISHTEQNATYNEFLTTVEAVISQRDREKD